MKRALSTFAFLTIAAGTSALSGAVRFAETDAVPLPKLRSYIAGGHRIEFTNDGHLLMSGPFIEVNGVERDSFARLGSDGTLDTTYAPAALFTQRNAARGPWRSDNAGRVLFFDVDYGTGGTVATASLRRLAVDGSLDATYKLDATLGSTSTGENPRLSTLIAVSGGRTLVGGRFDKLGDVSNKDWALLRADGTIDATFKPSWPDSLFVVVPMDDGRWIIGTVTYPTEPTSATSWAPTYTLSRVLADGSPDTTFAPYVTSVSASMSGPHAFAFDDAGRLIFAEFVPVSTDPGTNVMRLGRLGTDGRRDESFAPQLPAILENVLPYALSNSPDTPTFVSPQTLIYVPPRVHQIVADGSGGLFVLTPWKDASYGGIVHVTDTGVIGKSSFPVGATDGALWLSRDSTGRWWSEFVERREAFTRARPVRLLGSSTIDPGFSVATLATASVNGASALPGGALALEGWFDLAGGLERPGVAIVESNGALRATAALPWRAHIISVLGDGSLLLGQVNTGAIILASDASILMSSASSVNTPGTPRLARVFPDGSVLGLLAGLSTTPYATEGWLDRGGRILLVSPGSAFRQELPADLVRLTNAGALDPTFQARVQGGTSPALIEKACVDADGNGAWTLSWQTGTRRITHLDASGNEIATIALQAVRDDGTSNWIADLAPAPEGVFVAGRFDVLNRVRSPGVALVRSDGTIDATWGGGLRAGSAVHDVQSLGNGFVLAGGDLATAEGSVYSAVLDAHGLPASGAPTEKYLQLSASPDGAWLSSYRLPVPPVPVSVRRWKAQSSFEPPFSAPTGAVHLGDTVTLRVDWIGVPVSITWSRDGVKIAGASGSTFSFIPTSADEGAVFFATLHFEDGSTLTTRSWRLVLDGPHARMTNGSIRAMAGVGEQTLIIGCDLAGVGRDTVLVRALGPALGELGVGSAARSALQSVMRGNGAPVIPPADYTWARTGLGGVHVDVIAASRSVAAFKPDAIFLSGNDQMLYPAPGSGTLHVHIAPRASGDAGIVLGELFSISNASGNVHSTWLRNFSGRAPVRSGSGVLIGGFVVDGDRALRVLVRGVGPGLARFGVAGAAGNPRLNLFAGQNLVASNDNWNANAAEAQAITDAGTSARAFPLDAHSLDAAVVVSLPPGIYTAVISADPDGEGIALLEVYALD